MRGYLKDVYFPWIKPVWGEYWYWLSKSLLLFIIVLIFKADIFVFKVRAWIFHYWRVTKKTWTDQEHFQTLNETFIFNTNFYVQVVRYFRLILDFLILLLYLSVLWRLSLVYLHLHRLIELIFILVFAFIVYFSIVFLFMETNHKQY